MDSHQEYVLREVAQKNIRFIRLWFTDVAGVLKSISIDPGELEEAFAEGIGFDGSAVEGLTRVYESDMLLKPDASTFQLLPWRSNEDPVARMFCDVLMPDGRPAPSDPRGVLERAVERAADAGFRVMIHPEIEFYLLRQPVTPDRMIPVDQAGYFDHVARGDSNDFRRRAVRMLEDMAIPVEFSHHEGGPGQNEIDLRAVDPVRAADNIMTARTLIEEVALREELVATFMPKPFIEHPGSGMHTHLSLFEGEENAFFSPAGQYRQFKNLLHEGRFYYLNGKVQARDGRLQLVLNNLKEAVSERFWIQVANHNHDSDIYHILEQYKGQIPVVIRYEDEQKNVLLQGYFVTKDASLQESLNQITMKTIYR